MTLPLELQVDAMDDLPDLPGMVIGDADRPTVVDGISIRITLPPGRATVIGRTASADVMLRGFSVSRHHARIADETGVWMVEDAGSSCGTCLNGEQTFGDRIQLCLGDRIGIGRFGLLVLGGVAPAGEGRASARQPMGRGRLPEPPDGAEATFRIRDDAVWPAPAEGVDRLIDAFGLDQPLLDRIREARHGGTADLRSLDTASFLRLIETTEDSCLGQIISGCSAVRARVMLERLLALLELLRVDVRAADRRPRAFSPWLAEGLSRVVGLPWRDGSWRKFLAADPAWTSSALEQVLEAVPGSAEQAVLAGVKGLPGLKRRQVLLRLAVHARGELRRAALKVLDTGW